MDLKKYISEAISSGKFRRSSAKGPDNLSFDSVIKWLTSLGIKRLTDREFDGPKFLDGKEGVLFWAGISKYYKCRDIVVWMMLDGVFRVFDIVYHDSSDEPSKIFVDKNGFSDMVRCTTVEIIDFIRQCLL